MQFVLKHLLGTEPSRNWTSASSPEIWFYSGRSTDNIKEDYQPDFGRHSFVGRTSARQLVQDPVPEGQGGRDVLLRTRGVGLGRRCHPFGEAGAGVCEAEGGAAQDVQVVRSLLDGKVLGCPPDALGDLSSETDEGDKRRIYSQL